MFNKLGRIGNRTISETILEEEVSLDLETGKKTIQLADGSVQNCMKIMPV